MTTGGDYWVTGDSVGWTVAGSNARDTRRTASQAGWLVGGPPQGATASVAVYTDKPSTRRRRAANQQTRRCRSSAGTSSSTSSNTAVTASDVDDQPTYHFDQAPHRNHTGDATPPIRPGFTGLS